MMLLASLVFMIVGALPPTPEWTGQGAYEQILGITPRIFLASMIAYFAGEFSNSYLLAKLKVKTAGKYLWMRTISSTIVGQAIDTSLFLLVAFAGVLEPQLLGVIFISNYIFKVGVEALFTPITYRVTSFLKAREQEDFYDKETDFNPFKIRENVKKVKPGVS